MTDYANDGYGLQPRTYTDTMVPNVSPQNTEGNRYASGSAPMPAPEGTVNVPGIGYVDADVAASLGLGPSAAPMAPEGTQVAPEFERDGFPRQDPDPEDHELTDEELQALQDEIEDLKDREPRLSATADEIAACYGKDYDATVQWMAVNSNEAVLEDLSKATGLDTQTATALIEAAVMEAAPVAEEHIGSDRWQALVYAASATPDPMARRIVADVVNGKLHPSKLSRSYALWYDSLPDAD